MTNPELNLIPGLTREQAARILAAPIGIQFDLNLDIPVDKQQLEMAV